MIRVVFFLLVLVVVWDVVNATHSDQRVDALYLRLMFPPEATK